MGRTKEESKCGARISTMYRRSGGTNHMHWCRECRYLMRYDSKKKSRCKCLLYGDDGTTASDWNEGWVSCKNFRDRSEMDALKKRKGSEDEQLEGQMSFEDFGI